MNPSITRAIQRSEQAVANARQTVQGLTSTSPQQQQDQLVVTNLAEAVTSALKRLNRDLSAGQDAVKQADRNARAQKIKQDLRTVAEETSLLESATNDLKSNNKLSPGTTGRLAGLDWALYQFLTTDWTAAPQPQQPGPNPFQGALNRSNDTWAPPDPNQQQQTPDPTGPMQGNGGVTTPAQPGNQNPHQNPNQNQGHTGLGPRIMGPGLSHGALGQFGGSGIGGMGQGAGMGPGYGVGGGGGQQSGGFGSGGVGSSAGGFGGGNGFSGEGPSVGPDPGTSGLGGSGGGGISLGGAAQGVGATGDGASGAARGVGQSVSNGLNADPTSAAPGGVQPQQDPNGGASDGGGDTDEFGYGGEPINDAPTAPGGDPGGSESGYSGGDFFPNDLTDGGANQDHSEDPNAPTSGGASDPDSPDGGSEGPSITKGGGFRPHGGNTGGASGGFPDPYGAEDFGALFGYGVGAGGGSDWGGTNPHYDADPENSGPPQGNGASTSYDADAMSADDASSASGYTPPPPGSYQDEFWNGNNPHYTPYGSNWTPDANAGVATRSQMVTRSNLVSRVTIMKAGI